MTVIYYRSPHRRLRHNPRHTFIRVALGVVSIDQSVSRDFRQ